MKERKLIAEMQDTIEKVDMPLHSDTYNFDRIVQLLTKMIQGSCTVCLLVVMSR